MSSGAKLKPTYFSAKIVGLAFNCFNESMDVIIGFCFASRSTPALPVAAELPFLKAIPLENPVGDNVDAKLICGSLLLLDGRYDIEDCLRPFLILTLLALNGDKDPGLGSESALELCETGEREGERECEERTEPEASWRGRGPEYNLFNE